MAVGVLLALCLAGYIPLTVRQERSFNNQAFRTLSSVADQLANRVSNYASSLEQAYKLTPETEGLSAAFRDQSTWNRQGSEKLQGYLTLLEQQRPQERYRQKAILTEFINDQVRGLRHVPCDDEVIRGARPDRVTVRIRAQRSRHHLRFAFRATCADAWIDETVEPFLPAIPADLFDEVMVADDAGNVLFQTPNTGLRLTALEPLRIRAEEGFLGPGWGGETDMPAQEEEGESPGTLKFGDASRSSTVLPVRLGGRAFNLYTTPVPLSPSELDGKRLVVCALVAREHLRRQAMSVPWTWLISGLLALLIIMIGSWPLLKAMTMTAFERIPKNAGVYYVISTVATVLLGFLLVIHLRYISDFAEVDEQLEHLARSIDRNVAEETARSLRVLEAAEYADAFTVKPSSSASQAITPCVPREDHTFDSEQRNLLAEAGVHVADYPYFDLLFWSDRKGAQRAKWSVRETITPPTWLCGYDFFQAALQDDYWSFPGQSWERFRIDPTYSPNTGEYHAVISRPVSEHQDELLAGHLVTPALSLIQPVLPPEYGFAIVTDAGQVLFHSVPTKNARENFFNESEDASEVRGPVQAGRAEFLTAGYGGLPHRMFVWPLKSIEKCPWTVIVFRNLAARNAQHIDTVLLCCFLALIYGLFWCLVLMAFRLRKRRQGDDPYPAAWLWPDPGRAGLYVHLTLVLLIVTGATYVAFFSLPPGAVLGAGVIVPVTALLWVRWAVLGRYFRIINWSIFLTSVLLVGTQFLSAGKEAWIGAILVIVAYASLSFSSISKWLQGVGSWSHEFFYKAVWLGSLLLFSFLPGVALYKLAWDCQEWVFTHQEQVSIARTLQRRAERVQQYYSRVRIADETAQAEWLFLQRRLQREQLDRYDKALLSVHGQRFSAHEPRRTLAPVLWFASWTLPSGGAIKTQRRIDWSREGSRWNWELDGSNRLRLIPASGSNVPQAVAAGPHAGALWQSAATTEFEPDLDLVTELRDLQAGDFLKRISLPATLVVVVSFWWIGRSTRQMLGLGFRHGKPLEEVSLATIPAGADRVVLLGGPEENKTTELKRRSSEIHRIDTEEAIDDDYLALELIKQPAVALDHFEYRLDDPKASAAKLSIIRRLERLKKKVMLVSTIDPVFYWQDGAAGKPTESLENQVDHPAVALRSFEVKRIKPSVTPSKSVYSSLWLTCSPSEKIALHQLATEGWSNYKNADALRHLYQRKILCDRNDHRSRFQFVDDGFREFILNSMSPQERDALSRASGPSAWAGIRWVFVVVFLAAVAVVLLLSDQQMLGMAVSAASFLMPVYRLVSTLRANSLFAAFSKDSATAA